VEGAVLRNMLYSECEYIERHCLNFPLLNVRILRVYHGLQRQNGSQTGTPDVGEKIQVRWPDGRLYSGVYRGTNRVNMFLVSTSMFPLTYTQSILCLGLDFTTAFRRG
jgi:hypothetical protein